MDRSVEIICVGNELLIGKTLNTNAQWLAKRITTLGLSVSRITIVGDYVDEISSMTKEALQRNTKQNLFMASKVNGLKYKSEILLDFKEAYKILGITAPEEV